MTTLSPIPEIIADIRAGKMVILVDDEDRENEGDIVLASDFVTAEAINFMVTHCRGLVCLTLTEERTRQLGLTQMTQVNNTPYNTAFTVSIEAAEGVTTGISAADRARTIAAAVAPNASAKDIVQPGHIFPITARPGGVLVRAGHTEAGCDLAGLAGLTPSAVICEIMNEDGSMARLPELLKFAEKHGIKIAAITDLIAWRSAHESLIEQIGERPVQTQWGTFNLTAFRDTASGATHFALAKGHIQAEQETLVRVHEPLSAVDWLDDGSAQHSWRLPQTLAHFAQSEQAAVLILLHKTEQSSEIFARLFPDAAPQTPRKWDPKTYGIGAQMLKHLGVGKMCLLSRPVPIPNMAGFHLEICSYLLPDGQRDMVN